jgi:DNA-directed RNA polymerase subunit beta'
VEINDKHIEIIVRQMLRKVKITDPGDTSLLWGDQVDRLDFEKENATGRRAGRQASGSDSGVARHHQGFARDDSFISAASFQDTTRVLTEAATLGKVDNLRGFKENVIMGHLIPAAPASQPSARSNSWNSASRSARR